MHPIHPSIKSRLIAVFSSLALAFLVSGCVMVKTPKMPPEWESAARLSSGTRTEITGVYQDDGKLSFVLSRILREKVFSVRAPQIEFQLPDPKHVLVRARQGDRVLEERTFDATFEPQTGTVVLRSEMKADAGKEGAEWQGRRVKFLKGADGYLYGEYVEYGAGAFFYVLPVAGSAGRWQRWAPYEPAPVVVTR